MDHRYLRASIHEICDAIARGVFPEPGRDPFEDCLVRIDAALRDEPLSARLHILRAEFLGYLSRRDDALTAFATAERLDPHDPEVFYQRALLLKTGDPVRAEEDVDNALRLNPRDPRFLLLKGNFRRKRHWWSGAVEFYNRALEIKPDWEEALWERGYSLRELGRTKESEEDLAKADHMEKERLKPSAKQH